MSVENDVSHCYIFWPAAPCLANTMSLAERNDSNMNRETIDARSFSVRATTNRFTPFERTKPPASGIARTAIDAHLGNALPNTGHDNDLVRPCDLSARRRR